MNVCLFRKISLPMELVTCAGFYLCPFHISVTSTPLRLTSNNKSHPKKKWIQMLNKVVSSKL